MVELLIKLFVKVWSKSTARLATSMSALPILAVQKYTECNERMLSKLRLLFAAKGGGVHPLKGIVSWVHNVVRQLV